MVHNELFSYVPRNYVQLFQLNNLCSVEFQQIYLFAEEIISHFV